MKNSIFLSLCLLFFASCAPLVKTEISQPRMPLDKKGEVMVIGPEGAVPQIAQILGTVRVGDNGFSVNCSYEKVLARAKSEVLAAGGNALKITEHKLPTALGSSCHRITATILYISEQDYLDMTTENSAKPDSALLAEGCAMIHIYRSGGAGGLVSYNVNVGDEVIARVSNNSKESVKIKAQGETTFWARTESRDEVTIPVEPGYHYYIRCSLKMGIMVGTPSLDWVDQQIGALEYESIGKNKSE